ncbi:hypothetical protein [Halomarina oriensis]|uniref:DUF3883 domain-containing protein n=1 Tax=Halomarina oriensis TaxID=671145 RepID=A0A6B0GQ16_9EURY|nr:hypothetical protein [Halomarina oriensis]MWG36942.1 hypothetical protein [Halomarina oriensis]
MTRRGRANEDRGRFAEEAVAEHYGVTHAPDVTDWYDCINESTGTKFEVKSTVEELASGRSGRFRVWEDQTVSLIASDRQGTAWVVFVLFDRRERIVAVRRVRPSTVARLVHADGGDWNLAGHSERDGRQHKIAWDDVIRPQDRL